MKELEKKQRLSHSKIWQFQQDYFNEKGIDSWKGAVPFYVTSNSVIATTYANTIITYIQESIERGIIDPKEAITCIELGSGSGKFSFLCLTHLDTLRHTFGLEHLKFQYVMTDFTERIISYWEKQPQLKHFQEKGLLDYAKYDCYQTHPIKLKYSGEILDSNSRKNPLIVISNYLFDTIPHDAFKVENHTLYEGLITTSSPKSNCKKKGVISMDPLKHHFDFKPINTEYYKNEPLNAVLENYKNTLKSATFIIPIGGVQCIDHLASLSKQGAFIISADKGHINEQNFEDIKQVHIAFHGSFSLMTNFDALSKYIHLKGGQSHLPTENAGLKVCLFWTHSKENYPKTNHIFNLLNNRMPPESFILLKNILLKQAENHTPDELYTLLDLAYWDPEVLFSLSEVLNKKIQTITLRDQSILQRGLKLAEAQVYIFPNKVHQLFEIGRLYYLISEYTHAMECYKKSMTLFELEDEAHHYNIGLCHYVLNEKKEAELQFKLALKLNPNYTWAKEGLSLL